MFCFESGNVIDNGFLDLLNEFLEGSTSTQPGSSPRLITLNSSTYDFQIRELGEYFPLYAAAIQEVNILTQDEADTIETLKIAYNLLQTDIQIKKTCDCLLENGMDKYDVLFRLSLFRLISCLRLSAKKEVPTKMKIL